MGEIFVEVNTKKQADNLLAQTRILDLDIRVTAHRNLKTSEGVISEPYVLTETEADMLEGLMEQSVTAVRLITIP